MDLLSEPEFIEDNRDIQLNITPSGSMYSDEYFAIISARDKAIAEMKARKNYTTDTMADGKITNDKTKKTYLKLDPLDEEHEFIEDNRDIQLNITPSGSMYSDEYFAIISARDKAIAEMKAKKSYATYTNITGGSISSTKTQRNLDAK
jgi:20S proteasome alpha/beta subunit